MPCRSALVFLPSVPFTFGQTPWVIEIEDIISLFYPFIHNGKTCLIDIRSHYSYPLIKALIEAKNCKGIFTHVRSTAESLPKLFQNPSLKDKIVYRPLGIALAPQQPPKSAHEKVSFLLTNSWHQDPRSFYIRGGLDVLEAYALVKKRFGEKTHLTIRSRLPKNLGEKYTNIIKDCGISVLEEFLPEAKLQCLLAETDIYLLPSDRIHVVSLLQAMSYGKAVITSDGWGIEEYIKDGHNGIITEGRYGKVTWVDEKTGMLCENYSLMSQADPSFVEKLSSNMTLLIENRAKREEIGRNAMRDIKEKYNIANWNDGMKELFDKAFASLS